VRALCPEVVRRTEHFGSTAVPGIDAKPVIDVLVEIDDFEHALRSLRPVLEQDGYRYMWRDDSEPGHMMFVKGYGDEGYEPGQQLFHLHAAPAGHPLFERLLFRDYLRAHADAARRYQALKRELAVRFRNHREHYTEAKAAFVAEIMAAARAEG
jgi:GrpB-like predicted nucleotidyltransferase (UPF0157 family)